MHLPVNTDELTGLANVRSLSAQLGATAQFVVLLPYAGRQAALGMADLPRQKLTALEFGEPFTLSIGVAVASAQVTGLDLLHVAAKRLSTAQAGGGDRIMAESVPAHQNSGQELDVA